MSRYIGSDPYIGVREPGDIPFWIAIEKPFSKHLNAFGQRSLSHSPSSTYDDAEPQTQADRRGTAIQCRLCRTDAPVSRV